MGRWAEAPRKRALDLLIHLALARFDGRPTFGHLPLTLRRDIKALFASYAQACKQADALLFSLGQTRGSERRVYRLANRKEDAGSPLCTSQRGRSAVGNMTGIRGVRAGVYRSGRRGQRRQDKTA
jgi:hypothetical protein